MEIVGVQLMGNNALVVDVQTRTFSAGTSEELTAIERLKFALPKNSFTCIVGPSGCGKTTTLRMILGLDTQYQGRIELVGNGPVAAVFQEPRLLPWRSVEQNVRLVLPPERQNESLDELFSVLGLGELRTFFPNQLSLGLARRVALARAFVLKPQLLILDEPFVSLDEATALRLRSLLLALWKSQPTTALMVTHDIAEAAAMADQVLIFSERPARLLHTLNIDTPRAERNQAELDGIRQRIAQEIVSPIDT